MTEAIKTVATKSWRTTLNAFLAMLVALHASVASPLLDEIETTEPNWNVAIVAVLGFFALWNARDHKVSSEEAGALKAPEATP